MLKARKKTQMIKREDAGIENSYDILENPFYQSLFQFKARAEMDNDQSFESLSYTAEINSNLIKIVLNLAYLS